MIFLLLLIQFLWFWWNCHILHNLCVYTDRYLVAAWVGERVSGWVDHLGWVVCGMQWWFYFPEGFLSVGHFWVDWWHVLGFFWLSGCVCCGLAQMGWFSYLWLIFYFLIVFGDLAVGRDLSGVSGDCEGVLWGSSVWRGECNFFQILIPQSRSIYSVWLGYSKLSLSDAEGGMMSNVGIGWRLWFFLYNLVSSFPFESVYTVQSR